MQQPQPTRHAVRSLAMLTALVWILQVAVASATMAVAALTNNEYPDFEPSISGERIAWTAGIPIGFFQWNTQIHTCILGGPVVELGSAAEDGHPVVSGDHVFWEGHGGSDGGEDTEVFMWTPTGGVVQITANAVWDVNLQASGDRLVWNTQGNDPDGDPDGDDTDEEIFTWTPTSGVVRLTTNFVGDSSAQISGDRVAWNASGGSDGGTDLEIFTWTPSGGVVQLTQNAKGDWLAGLSGNRVVWTAQGGSDGGSDPEVFTWTSAEGTMQLTENAAFENAVVVSGDRVSWWTADGLYSQLVPSAAVQITALDGSTFPHQLVASGDSLVWVMEGGTDGGTDFEVFRWIPDEGVRQLTANTWSDWRVDLTETRVVWEGGNNGGYAEIYTAGAPIVWPTPVYRFYNTRTGTHFYTADPGEMQRVRDTMSNVYTFEGVGYTINTSNPANSAPLYRFYNKKTGTHLYTADEGEKNTILGTLSAIYSLDGVAYNVSMTSGTQVHRFFSPSKGVHFYSSDPVEIANVRATLGHIWSYEGPAYYVGQ